MRGPPFPVELLDRAADGVGRDMGMAPLHACLESLQAGLDLGDVKGAAFAVEFRIGAAVDKEKASGNGLTCAGVDKVVVEHGEPVLFAGQRGIGFATTALFDGQETSALPMQVVGVGVIEGPVVIPTHGTQGMVTVAVETADMIGGVGATVGDHE
jgi:hypothetical protein